MLIEIEMNDGADIPQRVLSFCEENGYEVERDGSRVILSKPPCDENYFSVIYNTVWRLNYRTAVVVFHVRNRVKGGQMHCMKFVRSVHPSEPGVVKYIPWEKDATILDEMMAFEMFRQEIEKEKEDADSD